MDAFPGEGLRGVPRRRIFAKPGEDAPGIASMKEIDLSLYFEPCPFMEAGAFYQDDTLRLGRVVEKYTVQGRFPSVEGAAVAFIGLSESRGGLSCGGVLSPERSCNGADAVRKDLYNLYPPSLPGKIVDLGNLRNGKTVEDTYFALHEVLACLLAQHTVAILVGGTQDLTFAVYKAYARLRRMASLLSVDSRLNIAEGLGPDVDFRTAPVSHDSYMSRIVVEPDNYLFNYMNVGYQTYLVDSEALSLMSRLSFDACRLGLVQGSIEETEPYVRDADCLSFDLCSLKRSQSPGNPWARPTGLDAEEACQIFRYAGLSKGTDVAGVFEYYPDLDKEGLSASLVSEMLWCFLDAMQHRIDDHPFSSSKVEYTQYTVPLEGVEKDLVFYKCKQTDRWWMELPCSPEKQQQYGRHRFLPCSYADYKTALQNEIPPRWWAAVQRLR